jgi:arabinoxylan arabinofuranohydrolase
MHAIGDQRCSVYGQPQGSKKEEEAKFEFGEPMRTYASILYLAFLAFVFGCTGVMSSAENPVIQTNFTADPAPLVYNGTLYLYTSHDEDDATEFKMLNWKLYTTTDMVNWTDHGTIASLAIFPWAVQSNDAWAPQVVQRNGKVFLYVPISAPGSPKNVIAVAVSDSPLGPFKDALGHPLIDRGEGYIDPTVYIDDDGQAYLYWGNPNLWYVKLNKDMISYSGAIEKVGSKPDNYQEGPWFYKREGKYYMAYASHCCPEGIGYAMSDGPTGPWKYKGMVMEPNPASSGNHPGIVDYKGSSYVFGFNYALNRALTDVHRERRSICVAKLKYNADGTILTVPWWSKEGVAQVGTLSPFHRTEAATIAFESGIQTVQSDKAGLYVTGIANGSYIKVAGVDFGENRASSFTASVASGSNGGVIELRLNSIDGPQIGSLPVSSTGGWYNWKTETTPVQGANGIHDLYFLFKGDSSGQLFNFDSWEFGEKGARRPKS